MGTAIFIGSIFPIAFIYEMLKHDRSFKSQWYASRDWFGIDDDELTPIERSSAHANTYKKDS